MKPKYLSFTLYMLVLAAGPLTLEADGKDECEFYIVRRNIKYEAFLGEDLRISCTVKFCDDSPPTVSWFKLERNYENDVFILISDSSHRLKTEWQTLKHLEGVSSLIFQNIVTNDSGVYRCESEGQVGRNIKVNVTGTPNSEDEETFMPFIFYVVGIMGSLIIVMAIYAASKSTCKGDSRNTPDPDHQPSHHALPMGPICEGNQ
ncbi:B- and T-lymphocyte attenuator-like [Xyrichtys novacula]|uniref:B- and T-lymphocyte attenuator-like n=1 Tax=Xyrichtys novacula TaxID=13765 RepID=A0AAV1HQP8_XYRNO|nr:B- and T-lymphocyte attenuator-like [Xyrichtys novacula]